jgi:hypothetical protein
MHGLDREEEEESTFRFTLGCGIQYPPTSTHTTTPHAEEVDVGAREGDDVRTYVPSPPRLYLPSLCSTVPCRGPVCH